MYTAWGSMYRACRCIRRDRRCRCEANRQPCFGRRPAYSLCSATTKTIRFCSDLQSLRVTFMSPLFRVLAGLHMVLGATLLTQQSGTFSV